MRVKWKPHQEFCRRTLFVSGVYAIVNLQAKRAYVGESINIGLRVIDHIGSLEQSTHINKSMQDDCNEWGVEVFEPRCIKIVDDDIKRMIYEEKISRYIVEQKNYQLYSDYHISTPSRPVSGQQKEYLYNLKQNGHSYETIQRICNKEWQLDYSVGWYTSQIQKYARVNNKPAPITYQDAYGKYIHMVKMAKFANQESISGHIKSRQEFYVSGE